MNRTGVLLKKYAGCGIVFGMLTIVLLQQTGTDAAVQARGADSSHFTCGGWNVVFSPSLFTLSALSGVAAVSPTDVWAVGGGGNHGTYSRTLIEHWNGTSWQVVSPHIGAYLNSVTALSAGDVWAVGGTDASLTLSEHWDGTRWKVVPSPNGVNPVNILQGVAAVSPSDIWAVGYGGLHIGIPQETLIEHWNGTRWSIVPGPNGGSSNNNLTSVTAISSTDAWAVGYYYNVNTQQNAPLTQHYGPGDTNDLLGVTMVSAQGAWAVGYSLDSSTGFGSPLIEYSC